MSVPGLGSIVIYRMPNELMYSPYQGMPVPCIVASTYANPGLEGAPSSASLVNLVSLGSSGTGWGCGSGWFLDVAEGTGDGEYQVVQYAARD